MPLKAKNRNLERKKCFFNKIESSKIRNKNVETRCPVLVSNPVYHGGEPSVIPAGHHPPLVLKITKDVWEKFT